MTELAERLGYPADARLVIISCDDLGASHAANEGVLGALHDGLATCASLMVPAPWARHAAAGCRPGDDIGVHLTLNCEYDAYRFGPITHAPSLLSGDGGFPRTLDDLWDHADPAEVLRECRAQIERAQAWGIDVTHLAPHLTAFTLRPEFFDVYLGLAVEFRIPVRLPSTISEDQAGFPFRRLAADEGVVFPDHFNHDWRAGSRERVFGTLATLAPGVTEIHVQPALDTPEAMALSASAADWVDDFRLMTAEPELARAIDRAGVVLIGFRSLRAVMRGEAPAPGGTP